MRLSIDVETALRRLAQVLQAGLQHSFGQQIQLEAREAACRDSVRSVHMTAARRALGWSVVNHVRQQCNEFSSKASRQCGQSYETAERRFTIGL